MEKVPPGKYCIKVLFKDWSGNEAFYYHIITIENLAPVSLVETISINQHDLDSMVYMHQEKSFEDPENYPLTIYMTIQCANGIPFPEV